MMWSRGLRCNVLSPQHHASAPSRIFSLVALCSESTRLPDARARSPRSLLTAISFGAARIEGTKFGNAFLANREHKHNG